MIPTTARRGEHVTDVLTDIGPQEKSRCAVLLSPSVLKTLLMYCRWVASVY